MDREIKEMFSLILNKLDRLDNRIDNLDNRIDKLDNRIDILDNRIDNLENKYALLTEKFAVIDSRQKEIFLVVKAIQHSNEMHKAEIDNLKLKVSKSEGNFSRIKDPIK